MKSEKHALIQKMDVNIKPAVCISMMWRHQGKRELSAL